MKKKRRIKKSIVSINRYRRFICKLRKDIYLWEQPKYWLIYKQTPETLDGFKLKCKCSKKSFPLIKDVKEYYTALIDPQKKIKWYFGSWKGKNKNE